MGESSLIVPSSQAGEGRIFMFPLSSNNSLDEVKAVETNCTCKGFSFWYTASEFFVSIHDSRIETTAVILTKISKKSYI